MKKYNSTSEQMADEVKTKHRKLVAFNDPDPEGRDWVSGNSPDLMDEFKGVPGWECSAKGYYVYTPWGLKVMPTTTMSVGGGYNTYFACNPKRNANGDPAVSKYGLPINGSDKNQWGIPKDFYKKKVKRIKPTP